MSENAKQPTNPIKNQRHISFLLRLWCAEGDESSDWQASLEVPGTGKRIGFASLEQLFAYLMDLSADQASNAGQESKRKSIT